MRTFDRIMQLFSPMNIRFCNLFLIVFIGIALMPVSLFATHQRSAEITYRHLSGLTYEITLISYTYTPSPANAYRDYLTIHWGDGISSDIPRVEIKNLPNDISYNRYVGEHTFPGPSNYLISCEDPNRNGGILNIPNSINVPLFIYSELIISPFIGGYNNSPVLLLPPIDNACVNQPFLHNPGAWDEDGDSLSYRLITCYGAMGLPIPGYTLPPATDSLTLNPLTGDFYWDSPPQQGEYNIAILIEEWRNGIKIGSILRDMQIIVIACNNRPPEIEHIDDTCVEAGRQLSFPITAVDPDSNVITLTATGGAFLVAQNKAQMDPDPAIDTARVTAWFVWNTLCNHIKRQPYPTFFKARDNSKPVNLTDILLMHITVIGPPPENLMSTPLGTSITLSWDPYSCQNAIGYYLYRKTDSTGFIPGYCETGVPPYLGYSRIATITNLSQTTYFDNNNGQGLVQGVKYCYLLTAFYPDMAESYASNETCSTLKKDLPVITNVSIRNTDEHHGSLYLAWSRPTELDTVQAPGPWSYVVNRARSDNPDTYAPVQTYHHLNDTIFIDTLLHTSGYFYRYKIDLYNDTPGMTFLIGTSHFAESMFIGFVPTDQKLHLFWNANVPWSNFLYTIYRFNPPDATFDSIGSSAVTTYTDGPLTNGEEYCYFIRSSGQYSATGFIYPIINFSQINCGVPVDNIPPCPPVLSVNTECDLSVNHLSWTNPVGDTCTFDIQKYIIYYSPDKQQDLKPIDSIPDPYDTAFSHKPGISITGCYAVTAVDSTGNESAFSNFVCVDYTACPIYRLPKAFTPNGDGHNDLLIPFPYTSVERINLNLYNRWGKEVFQTHDPDINWDGKDCTTNQPCSDGVYFYVCDVFEITLEGTIKRTLRGSVTILR